QQMFVPRIERIAERIGGDDTVVRPDASYVITGGWGALGLEVAGWLIGRGARQLVLNGRSQPAVAATALLDAWRADGVVIDCVAGDVGDPAVAAQLVATAAARAPLRG